MAIQIRSAPGCARETSTARDTAASNSNHEHCVSIGAEGSMSLFGFPPEIRHMIWEFLLPGRRVLSVRTKHEGGVENARLTLQGKPKQPILSQICQESRNLLLRRGAFIFKKGNNGGFWWSSDDDVFLVDRPCGLAALSYSLEALDGLNLIQNIAVDSFQAAAIVWIRQEPKGANTGMTIDNEETASVRWLLSWGKVWDCPFYKHPILRFFKHSGRLTVHFAQPFHDHPSDELLCNLLGECSLTLDIPAKDVKTGVHGIEEFHRKWADLPGGVDNDGLPCRWRRRPSITRQVPDSVDFCKSPSFRDSGDHITTEWGTQHRIAWRLCLSRERNRDRNRDSNQS